MAHIASPGGVEWEQVQRRASVLNSQPLVWTPEAVWAWEESKGMVAKAVGLAVPDWEGAASGENPFVYYADRSLYGVGGGLFQRNGSGVV